MSESEQEWWLARHRREHARHTCGHPQAVCSDPDHQWFPQREVCYPTMERMAAQARYEDLHQSRPWHDGSFTSWGEKRSAQHPYHHSHGVTIWVADEDLGHGGDFLSSAAHKAGSDEAKAEDAEE